MTATPARQAARKIVSAVRQRGAWAHEAADGVLRDARLDTREAASATRLAYGTLSALGTLDEAIDASASRASAIEPVVRDSLRIAAWELLFSDSPSRAVVSEGVELVRTTTPRAAGFANAVLRRIADSRTEFPFGDPASDVGALARSTAHPRWIVDLAFQTLGEQAAREMLAADNAPAPLYLAENPFLATPAEVMARLASDGADPRDCAITGCVEAAIPSAAVRGTALADGLVFVVDAAAQLAVQLAAPKPGSRVAEIGAGRGTKCALLQANAVRAGGTATVLGVELHEFKVKVLDERLAALGVPNVTGVVADATDAAALLNTIGGAVDLVFVDAPCSGLGTLRRHPDKRWRVTPDEVTSLAALGGALLSSAARLVDPGGVVVYSTCTITAEENEAVVDAFLGSEEGTRFHIDSVSGRVPDAWERFVTERGFFRSWPRLGGPDGHFVARLVRA